MSSLGAYWGVLGRRLRYLAEKMGRMGGRERGKRHGTIGSRSAAIAEVEVMVTGETD